MATASKPSNGLSKPSANPRWVLARSWNSSSATGNYGVGVSAGASMQLSCMPSSALLDQHIQLSQAFEDPLSSRSMALKCSSNEP
eukprot:5872437-Amphidinium_carterae.1